MKTGMKRLLTTIVLLLSITVLSSASTSPYYTKSVVVVKVYPHKLGFKVLYMANDLQVKEIYLPNTLFEQQEEGGRERSKVFKGYDKTYPYLTVFWKDGEFSHVKLYLKPDYSDVTWGALHDPDAHDENFRNATLEFDF